MTRTTGRVGRSERSVTKHNLMRLVVQDVVIGLRKLRPYGIERLLLLDLCAGDGSPGIDETFAEGTSAGVLAYRARDIDKRVKVWIELCEKAPGTYRTLLANLAAYLPELGYEAIDGKDNCWSYRKLGRDVTLQATCCDSTTLKTDNTKPWWNRRTALFLMCDPNAMSQGPFRNELLQAAQEAGVWAIRGLLILGCNASGVQRGIPRKQREQWFGEVAKLVNLQQGKRDVLFGAILAKNGNLDAHKWAYVLFTPTEGKWGLRAEKYFRLAGNEGGYTLRTVWASETDRFRETLSELFLTRKEREEG